eukprot:GFYU01036430.1.p1 GENE.GFYU01036430.1~~GFYU01036430.1.p1  ORF type:complete len:149 (-),score=20.03 GFYU01036430.1:106-552(-)
MHARQINSSSSSPTRPSGVVIHASNDFPTSTTSPSSPSQVPAATAATAAADAAAFAAESAEGVAFSVLGTATRGEILPPSVTTSLDSFVFAVAVEDGDAVSTFPAVVVVVVLSALSVGGFAGSAFVVVVVVVGVVVVVVISSASVGAS